MRVRANLQDDLVVKLASFGFTVNQAKIYLSIVQSGKTCVGRISKGTQLHGLERSTLSRACCFVIKVQSTRST